MKLLSLPIDSVLPVLLSNLQKARALVLQATPGSGKTTRVPPAILRADFVRPGCQVLVLEPRRLAAKWAARRVAEEMGEAIGRTVGYQFRFERVGSGATRLWFLTEGMLMKRILGDPTLEKVAVVILDEFHERHIQGDTALAYLKWLQATSRPDLRIVVMSATLDTAALVAYLQHCPELRLESRQYPVEVEYLPASQAKSLEQLVCESAAGLQGGDHALVFLPGMGEILRCQEALRAVARAKNLLVLPLHGDLSREEQDRAILMTAQSKVILSTNIAETSLTIEGVNTVIDSGLHRQASFSWWSGMPSLKTRPISRASAIQRAGRAGRTAPGRCLRLYTKADFEGRSAFDLPEIRRADLSEVILEIKKLGITDLQLFPWFEAPTAQGLAAGTALLYRLGALTANAQSAALTDIGRRMGMLAGAPRLARVLIEAERLGVLDDAATLAAWIAEGGLETFLASEMLRRPMPERVRKIRSQFLGGFADQRRSLMGMSQEDALARSVLAGFSDRVAKKRVLSSRVDRGRASSLELVLSSGGAALIDESHAAVREETFVILDVQERQFQRQGRAEIKVRSVCPIREDWLLEVEPSVLQEVEELSWDAAKARVFKSSRLMYDQLTLLESHEPLHDVSALNELQKREFTALVLKKVFGIEEKEMFELSFEEWVQALSRIAERQELEACFGRLKLYAAATNDAALQAVLDEGSWASHLLLGLAREFSQENLKSLNWVAFILQAVESALARPGLSYDLEQKVPLFCMLPSGRRLKIHYALSQAPWIESRMQDFFGLKTGPMLFSGRIPLTLHLLAPNQRAVQITNDLAGFWERGYHEVRNQLCRRYPRHSWPENPLTAAPPLPKPRA